MILLFSFCFLFSVYGISFAQSDSPIVVVQKQLDAYNEQDINAFSDLFANDAEIFMNIGDEEPAIKGRKDIKKRYGKMFKENPQNKSTLVGRMVQGDFVFDHEWITGRNQEFKIVAIYEVKEGLITRAWFVR
jgi:hypothetical protein